MFSGHLAHLIGLSEMLTGDERLDRGFDLIWDGTLRFRYPHTRLVERIQAPMTANPHQGVAREPGHSAGPFERPVG